MPNVKQQVEVVTEQESDLLLNAPETSVFMSRRFSSGACSFCVSSLFVLTMAVHASAQTKPTLGIEITNGHANISITGDVGTVYSIQYASNLLTPNSWAERTVYGVEIHLTQGGGNHCWKA